MSNALVPAKLQLPAHLQNRVGQPSALGSALTGGISDGVSIPRISLKGSRFRIIEGGAETVLPSVELHAVIVGANPGLSKTWYAEQWTPDNEPTSPDCYSMTGIRPEPDSKQLQNDVCATCKWNQWGSKITPNGQKIKACADEKRLAIVAADDPGGTIYLLKVTPAVLKGLNQYHKELSVRGIPPEVVITKLSFDTSASFPKLVFSFGGFLDAERQAIVDDLFGSSQVLEITGEDSTPAQAQVEIAKPLLVAPAKAAAPVIEDAHIEEPAAKPRGFGGGAPAQQPVQQAPAKRGFGGGAPAEPAQPVQQKPVQRVVAEPVAAAKTTSTALAADITALLEGMNDDDDASGPVH